MFENMCRIWQNLLSLQKETAVKQSTFHPYGPPEVLFSHVIGQKHDLHGQGVKVSLVPLPISPDFTSTDFIDSLS